MKYASSGMKVASAAYTGLRLASQIASIVNAEKKYYDYAEGFNVQDSGIIRPLNAIPQGDGVSERVGDSCKNVSLNFNYTLAKSSNEAASQCRVILVCWKDPNLTLTPAQILEDLDVLSFKSWHNKNRSKILYDRLHLLNDAGGQSAGKETNMRVRVPFKGALAKFSHTRYGPASTGIDTNQYALLAISDQSVNPVVMTINSRLYYYDN
jgi:hypothetical protein